MTRYFFTVIVTYSILTTPVMCGEEDEDEYFDTGTPLTHQSKPAQNRLDILRTIILAQRPHPSASGAANTGERPSAPLTEGADSSAPAAHSTPDPFAELVDRHLLSPSPSSTMHSPAPPSDAAASEEGVAAPPRSSTAPLNTGSHDDSFPNLGNFWGDDGAD